MPAGPAKPVRTAKTTVGRRAMLGGLVALTAATTVSACGTDSDTTNKVNELNRSRFTTADGGNITWDEASERPTAPEFSGESLDEDNPTELNSTDYLGSILIVNFWGSWCGPCREEAEDLAATYEKYRGADTDADADNAAANTPVEFVGINIRDTPDAARDFETAHGIEYPSVNDPGGSIANDFVDVGVNPSTIPTTVVIDPDGKVFSLWRQTVTIEDLSGDIDALLAERTLS